jgi:hypothetical protein
MAGQGGFATRLNGTIDFIMDTAVTNVTSLTAFIGEVSGITLPELTKGDIDVSSFDSASNFMEYVGGQVEPGVIDVTLNYDAEEDALVETAFLSGNQKWYITFPDDTGIQTDGYLNKRGGGSAPQNGKIDRVVSIKCSGIPTQTTSMAY